MYKNQLQELAQRSCFSLPAYTCIREGPDHAPRFKATVSFNGEIFESPSYCSTLRQAEHAAAEVALNALSTRGPSPSLAARILDETGIGKNLLQETAQRAGLSLPVYTTIRAGPGHLPVFKCIVKVADRLFAGEPAKTKKQAEKNAAMVALSAIKQWTQPLMIADSSNAASDERDQSLNSHSNALTLYRGGDRSTQKPSTHSASRNHGGRSRVRVVNVRERNACYETGRGLLTSPPNAEIFRSEVMHTRNHSSFFGMDSRRVPSHEPLGAPMSHRVMPHQQLGSSRLSLQSCSDRFELRRPLLEEIQAFPIDRDDEWLSGTDAMLPKPPFSRMNTRLDNQRSLFQSQSERFELKPSLLDELYHREEEDWWLRGEVTTQPMTIFDRASSSAMHWDREMGSYMYHGGNRGLTHSSGYNSTGNDGMTYGGSVYKDANPIITYANGEEFGQNGSFISGSRETPNLRPPSYSALNIPAEGGSHSGNNGYNMTGFTVEASKGVFYQSDEGSNAAFRGYPNTSDINNGVSNDESSFPWTHSPPQSMMCRVPVPAQPFGLHSASSLAPPVRVRHMVTVCSAPSPRCTDMATPSLINGEANVHNGTPDTLPETSSLSLSASRLFGQLRL